MESVAAERLTELQKKDEEIMRLKVELAAREQVLSGLDADLRRAREEHELSVSWRTP
jgi:hypothetical protein